MAPPIYHPSSILHLSFICPSIHPPLSLHPSSRHFLGNTMCFCSPSHDCGALPSRQGLPHAACFASKQQKRENINEHFAHRERAHWEDREPRKSSSPGCWMPPRWDLKSRKEIFLSVPSHHSMLCGLSPTTTPPPVR